MTPTEEAIQKSSAELTNETKSKNPRNLEPPVQNTPDRAEKPRTDQLSEGPKATCTKEVNQKAYTWPTLTNETKLKSPERPEPGPESELEPEPDTRSEPEEKPKQGPRLGPSSKTKVSTVKNRASRDVTWRTRAQVRNRTKDRDKAKTKLQTRTGATPRARAGGGNRAGTRGAKARVRGVSTPEKGPTQTVPCIETTTQPREESPAKHKVPHKIQIKSQGQH